MCFVFFFSLARFDKAATDLYTTETCISLSAALFHFYAICVIIPTRVFL